MPANPTGCQRRQKVPRILANLLFQISFHPFDRSIFVEVSSDRFICSCIALGAEARSCIVKCDRTVCTVMTSGWSARAQRVGTRSGSGRHLNFDTRRREYEAAITIGGTGPISDVVVRWDRLGKMCRSHGAPVRGSTIRTQLTLSYVSSESSNNARVRTIN